MKSIQCLFTISFLAFTLNTLVFAEGGDGGGDGGGDSGGDGGDDGSGHYDGDGHHHDHGHHHNNFILGIGGFYDPWLWGGYYGPGMWRSYYGPGFWGPYGYRGYGYADPFFRPYYTYPPAVAAPSQPPIYIQQQEPKRAQPRTDYWHYCRDPQGYYPYIRECPGGWLQIPPQPNVQR